MVLGSVLSACSSDESAAQPSADGPRSASEDDSDVSTHRVRFASSGGEAAAPALLPRSRAALPNVTDTRRRLAGGP